MLNAEGVDSTETGTGIRDGMSGRKKRGRDRTSRGGRGKVVKRRDHWANQLCTPEWMLTVPSDLDGAGDPLGSGEKDSCMRTSRICPEICSLVPVS